jgi:hypothetical protein
MTDDRPHWKDVPKLRTPLLKAKKMTVTFNDKPKRTLKNKTMTLITDAHRMAMIAAARKPGATFSSVGKATKLSWSAVSNHLTNMGVTCHPGPGHRIDYVPPGPLGLATMKIIGKDKYEALYVRGEDPNAPKVAEGFPQPPTAVASMFDIDGDMLDRKRIYEQAGRTAVIDGCEVILRDTFTGTEINVTKKVRESDDKAAP